MTQACVICRCRDWTTVDQFTKLGFETTCRTSLRLSLHETFVSSIIPIYMSINAENLVKIGVGVAEVFGGICRFLPSYPKSCICYPHNLRRYWTKVTNQIYTRCRGIIGTIKPLIHMVIFWSILKCQGAKKRLVRQFCPKLVAMETSFEQYEQLHGWLCRELWEAFKTRTSKA